MRLRLFLAAVIALIVVGLSVPATASPYSETCGDGTLPSCVLHCIKYHGGVPNLHNCLWAHYLV